MRISNDHHTRFAMSSQHTKIILLRIAALFSMASFSLVVIQAARDKLRSRNAESIRLTNNVRSKPMDVITVKEPVEVTARTQHFTGPINGDYHCYFEDGDYPFRPKDNGNGVVGKGDDLSLGRCRYHYPVRYPPAKGYLNDLDYYFFREQHKQREECFLQCIDLLTTREISQELLIKATVMGLTKVVKKLLAAYEMDPLFVKPPQQGSSSWDGLNAIQEAIRGGYADIVKVLTDSDNELVIDKYGRTVADYIRMKGSPIRPVDAESILGIRVEDSADKDRKSAPLEDPSKSINDKLGWKQQTSLPFEDTCDIDVIHDDMTRGAFFKDYYSTGRPFVLRGQISSGELEDFSKSRWDSTSHLNTRVPVRVGPTAYPSNTGQSHCSYMMTTLDIENATECRDMPHVPMVHAIHPGKDDLDALYPRYGGNVYHPSSAWRKIEEWFGPSAAHRSKFSWQVFWGGDGSGATWHWHKAAYNVLYAGTKEWRVGPPLHRGWTGMPARDAMGRLDDAVTLRCTQHVGDIMWIPDYWGHLTLNHGFTIGAAAILPSLYQKGEDGYETAH